VGVSSAGVVPTVRRAPLAPVLVRKFARNQTTARSRL